MSDQLLNQIRAAAGKPPLSTALTTAKTAVEVQGRAIPVEEFPPIRLGKVILTREMMLTHLRVMGGSGSGKTQAIRQIQKAVRQRREKAIVVDHGGETGQRLLRDGIDHLLNPEDVRGENWCPFFEVRKRTDFARLADCMVASHSAADSFWADTERHILECGLEALWALGPSFRNNDALITYFIEAPQRGKDNKNSLEWLLKDTSAARYFDEGSERMLSNVLGMIATSISPLTFYRYHTGKPFSITRFMQSGPENQRWLFLAYSDTNMAALSPLVAMQFRFAVQAALGLPEATDETSYMFIDEMGSLPPMPIMYDALEKLRKRGWAVVAGLQSNRQIERPEKYGKEGAGALRANFKTVLALCVGDNETADELSLTIGDVRRWVTSGSTSVGESTSHTTTRSIQTERLLLPAQFMMLPVCEGYLRIGGTTEVIEMMGDNRIPFSDLPIINPLAEITRAESLLDIDAPWTPPNRKLAAPIAA